jgi:hypothetical protein
VVWDFFEAMHGPSFGVVACLLGFSSRFGGP